MNRNEDELVPLIFYLLFGDEDGSPGCSRVDLGKRGIEGDGYMGLQWFEPGCSVRSERWVLACNVHGGGHDARGVALLRRN